MAEKKSTKKDNKKTTKDVKKDVKDVKKEVKKVEKKVDKKEDDNRLLAIILVVLLLLVLLIVPVINKMIIYKNLSKRFNENIDNNVTYIKLDSELSTIEQFKDNNMKKYIIDFKEKPFKFVQVDKGNSSKEYMFYKTKKLVTVSKDEKSAMHINNPEGPMIGDFVRTFSFGDRLNKSIHSKVYNDIIDGKVCYVIENKNNEFLRMPNVVSVKVYIDKDTGLPIRLVEITDKDNHEKEHITNYVYSNRPIQNDEFNIDTKGYKVKRLEDAKN